MYKSIQKQVSSPTKCWKPTCQACNNFNLCVLWAEKMTNTSQIQYKIKVKKGSAVYPLKKKIVKKGWEFSMIKILNLFYFWVHAWVRNIGWGYIQNLVLLGGFYLNFIVYCSLDGVQLFNYRENMGE